MSKSNKPTTTDLEAAIRDVNSSLTSLNEKLGTITEHVRDAFDTNMSLKQITANSQNIQDSLSTLQSMKESLLSVNAHILQLTAECAANLHQQWKDVNVLNNSQLTKLQNLQLHRSESTERHLRKDMETRVQRQPAQIERSLLKAKATRKEVDFAVIEAINILGENLYHLLAKENTNVFFSPFGLSTSLAMLFCGARNETAEEMRKVLGYEAANIPDEDIKFCFQRLLDAVNSNQRYYTLHNANAVLSAIKFPAKEEYKLLVEQYFKALFKELDFVKERDSTVKLVNEWVKKKTNNMISNVLSTLNPMTAMINVNVVYFEGCWSDPFKEENTTPQCFFNSDRNSWKQVDMMKKFSSNQYNYAEMESYKVLQLPYKGHDIAMLILLPDFKDGLSELEKSLDSNFLKNIKQNISLQLFEEVALPKFKLEYSKSLNEHFQILGLKRVFDRRCAQLSGINSLDRLFLSEVSHKAVLEVNEKGTKAVAVTTRLLGGGYPPENLPKFIVDHPFMFVIYNTNNNLILFMGRVNEL